MNQREQFELENYLREFNPRAPRALSPANQSQNCRRLAAAIAIFFLASASFWGAFRRAERNMAAVHVKITESPVTVSTIPLTKLALENPQEFETVISDASVRTLPKFTRPDSSLQALAKE